MCSLGYVNVGVAIPTAVIVLSACRMYPAHIELGQW